jgi:hypothetical protein
VALLVGELYARVTSDSSQYRGDMEKVDKQGEASAKLAEKNALKIEAARKAEMAAAAKARAAEAALEQVRASNSSAEKLTAAESKLANARLALSAAQDKVVAVEEAIAAAMEKTTAAAEASGDAQEKAGQKAEAGAKKAGAAAEDAAKKTEGADRHAGKFAATLLAMGAAGGVAGTAIAAGLIAVPALLTLIAATALSTREDVQDAWGDLGSEMAAAIKDDLAPLAPVLVLASKQIAQGFHQIRPELRGMAADGGPAITMLVDGVVKLATGALPGMRRAVKDTGEGVAGFNALLDHTGDGIGDFFDEISNGSASAGRNAGNFGMVLEDLLGFAGKLLVTLSDDFDGTFSQIVGLLDTTTDSALGLADGALPSLAASGGVLVSVATSILGALGPIAPALGTIAGVMLSMKVGAAIFGAAGDAVTAFGGRLESAATGTGKAAGAVRGLGQGLGAIGPYGMIAGAALLGLVAASDAAFGSTDELASKLMAGGDAAEQAAKKISQNSLAVTVAKESTTGWGELLDLFAPTMEDTTKSIEEQRAGMTALQRAQVDTTAASANYLQAVEKHGPKSWEAAAAAGALTFEQRKLADIQKQAADATKTHTDRLIEQQAVALGFANASLGLRQAILGWSDAQNTLNKAVTDHGPASKEAQDANLALESSVLRVLGASQQEALSHYANKDSMEAQTAATQAVNAKALELAATSGGVVPQALQQFIAKMDASALAANGVTRSVDETGQTVLTLPDGKKIVLSSTAEEQRKLVEALGFKVENLPNGDFTITANTAGAQGVIDSFVRTNDGRVIHIRTETSTGVSTNLTGGGMQYKATGGPIRAGQAYTVGERGQEIIVPQEDAFVIPADQTKKFMDAMRAPALAVPEQRGSGSAALSMTGGNGRTIIIEKIVMNQVRTLPTAQELRNVLHDVEVQYG